MSLSVSQVAKLAGVSVRTLHHYDELGLVKPSGRSAGGYRQYARADLERLQQVLFFRELGFALEDVARLLDDPAFDRKAALLMQRRLLVERAARTQALVAAVDRSLDALHRGRAMSKEDLFEVFGSDDPKAHEPEAERRWGTSDAWKESQRRTKKYTKADWLRMRTESEAIVNELAMLAAAGRESSDPDVTAVAEKHRQHIDRWFYTCSYEIHRGLGEMYVADERFAANYEKVRPGLTQFLRDAIFANAERPYGSVETRDEVRPVQHQHVRRK